MKEKGFSYGMISNVTRKKNKTALSGKKIFAYASAPCKKYPVRYIMVGYSTIITSNLYFNPHKKAPDRS
jgi:hypothetical protein